MQVIALRQPWLSLQTSLPHLSKNSPRATLQLIRKGDIWEAPRTPRTAEPSPGYWQAAPKGLQGEAVSPFLTPHRMDPVLESGADGLSVRALPCLFRMTSAFLPLGLENAKVSQQSLWCPHLLIHTSFPEQALKPSGTDTHKMGGSVRAYLQQFLTCPVSPETPGGDSVCSSQESC